ncbi:MAG: hypothetical protein GX144_02340 [Clostridiaceae bacterium]|nr:hypothetical protein [Clostridiaceae bacterium]
MMLRITICDDDIRDLSQITNLINKYQNKKKIPLSMKPFKRYRPFRKHTQIYLSAGYI